MVLGNLIQINATGTEDKYLYGNPQVTYFKDVYKRSTNFAINYSKVPFTGSSSIDFGSQIRVSIPIKADLLGGVYFKINFSDIVRTSNFKESDAETNTDPHFTSYVNGIGFNCIEFIKLYINGQLIQTLDSKLIYLLNELNNIDAKKTSFYKMTRFYNDGFFIGDTNTSNVKCNLMLPLFFSGKPSQYLPLCALTHSDIQLHIKFKTKEECLVKSYNTEELPDQLTTFTDSVIVKTDEGTVPAAVGEFINNLPYTLDHANTSSLTDAVTSKIDETPNNLSKQMIYNIMDGNLSTTSQNNLYKVPVTHTKYDENVSASISSFEIITENIYLDQSEKVLFMNKELSYLIELHNIGDTHKISNPSAEHSHYIDFNAKHPTKYILWYLQREDVLENNMYDNHSSSNDVRFNSGTYTYESENHLIKDAVIMVNNTELINNVDAIFLSDVQMYQKFNNSCNSIIYLYSFALNPTEEEPSGTLNFSKVLHKTLKIQLEDASKYTNKVYNSSVTRFTEQTPANSESVKQDLLLKYYTCYYNILLIKDGLCSLVYQ